MEAAIVISVVTLGMLLSLFCGLLLAWLAGRIGEVIFTHVEEVRRMTAARCDQPVAELRRLGGM